MPRVGQRFPIVFRTAVAIVAMADALPSSSSAIAKDSDTELEEVIVTGEKLGRSLMDTPTSTVILDHRELENRAGLTTTRDVLETIPNVVLSGTGNTAPVIRGIDGTGAALGADAFFAGSRPRLNVQVDGRALSYNESVFGDSTIWDVQQIEVLRGAQSTLQGRNAIAGTIVTKTNDPTFDYNAALRVGGGNFEQRRASGMSSGPVDDSVAYRIAADWLSWHSFVKGWEGFPTVRDPGDFEALTVRGKFLFQPQSIEGCKTLLTVNHSDYSGPQTENVSRPFGAHFTDFTFEPVFEPKTTSVIADTQYALTPKLNVEGVLSGTDLNVKRKAVAGTGIVNIDGREYVFEPRLRYRGENRTAALAGLYLFRAHQDESIDFPTAQTFDDTITTAAVFGEGTLSLSEAFDLIAGARCEQEKHERHGGDNVSVAINLDETYRAFLYGAEFDANAVVTSGLEVYANIGLLHAKITQYPGSGFQGNELPLSPSTTTAAGLTYNRGGWDASLNARYSDSYFSDIENNPRGSVDPYWLANVQFGYSSGHVRIYGHVNNVFDTGKPIAIYSGATEAEDGANILKPRTYWVGVQWTL